MHQNTLKHEIKWVSKMYAQNRMANQRMMEILEQKPLHFLSAKYMPISTLINSNPITVHLEGKAPISIDNGEYRINGGFWTSTPGTINNGDSLQVRHLSASSNGETTSSTVTIWNFHGIFSISTSDYPPPNRKGQ